MASSEDASITLGNDFTAQVERIIEARQEVGDIIEAAGESIESLVRTLPGEELIELLRSVRDDVVAQRVDRKSIQLSELYRLASARPDYDRAFREYRGQLEEHLKEIARYMGRRGDDRDTIDEVDAINAGNIQGQPGKRRQRRRAVLAMASGIAVVVGSVVVLKGNAPAPCDDAGSAVTDVWTPERRSAIRRAFLNTGLSYAAVSWSTLEHGIDGYARQLESGMVKTCEATHEQVEPSDGAALRMHCLANCQRRLAVLLEQLEHADASVVERAHTAAAALPNLATCEHLKTPRHGMKLPAPEVESQVFDIRDQLALARTHEVWGRSDEALRIAREQIDQAKAVSSGPVEAEAMYQAGRVLAYRGTPEEREEGEDMLLRAANLAESERHYELVAEVWNFLVLSACHNHSSTTQAYQWHERADTAIRRIGDPPLYRAAALRNLGCLYFNDREFAKAEAASRNALAALQSAPASQLDRAAYQHDLAMILLRRGLYGEAQEIDELSLLVHIAELGATHPRVASVRYGLAMSHKEGGASAVARQFLDDLLRVHGETLGATNVLLGHTHLALAEISLQDGAPTRAHEHAMQSLDIYERAYGAGHVRLADAYARLGMIELRRGAHEKALAAYETGLAIKIRHLGPDHIDVGYDHLNLAEVRLAQGRPNEALVALDRAERILQPSLADIPSLGPFLASVRGRAHLGKGEFNAAVAALESAVQGFDTLSGAVMLVERADASWALVQALSKIGRADDPRAMTLARDALALYEWQGPEVHTPRHAVKRWLAAHGGR